MKKKIYKREVIFLDTGALIELIPNRQGGLKNSYLRIEDKRNLYVGSIDGKVGLQNLHRITGEMLSAYPVRKKKRKKLAKFLEQK